MTKPVRIADSLASLPQLRLARVAPQAPDEDSDRAAQAEAAERADEDRLAVLEARWATVARARFAEACWDAVEQPEEILGDLAAWRAAGLRWAGGQGPAPGNLVLIGPTGPGKTYVAMAIARDLHFAGAGAVFAPVVEMLGELRRGGRETSVSAYTAARVLVLDDLGAEKPSEWTQAQFYEVINARWLDRLPTIATTNLEPKELAGDAGIGRRNWDRIRDEAVVLRVTGASRRRAAP